jgi:hypothetical protein
LIRGPDLRLRTSVEAADPHEIVFIHFRAAFGSWAESPPMSCTSARPFAKGHRCGQPRPMRFC